MNTLPSLWRTFKAACLMIGIIPGLQWVACRAAGQPTSAESMESGRQLKLAALYLKLGNWDECRAVVTSLLRNDPRDVQALIILARLELRTGHRAEAERVSSSALALSPGDIECVVIKGAALTSRGRAAEAEALIQSLPPGDVLQARELLARILNGGTLPATATPGTANITAEPEDSPKQLALDAADKAMEAKDMAQADKLTLDAVRRWPEEEDILALRADYLSQANRSPEALALLEKMQALHQAARGPFPQQMDLAYALDEAGRKKEAAAAFAIVLKNPYYSSKDKTAAGQAIAEQRHSTLLSEGEKALVGGDLVEAARINQLLLSEDPASMEVKIFHASVLKASGKPAEAARILETVKEQAGAGKRFDSQMDYAAALAASQRYEAAIKAYHEVMASAGPYTDAEQSEAARELADLRERHSAGMLTEFTGGRYDEGRLWRAKQQFFSSSFNSTRYTASLGWDRIDLADRLFPTAKSADRYNVTAGASHQFSPSWSGSFAVGGYNAGAMGSATAEYAGPGGWVASLRVAANDPARDTLLVEAMDGRQHSVAAGLASPLGKYFAVDSSITARDMLVRDNEIGSSYGIESQFRWHPWTISRDFYLAYALERRDFNGRRSSFDKEARRYFDTDNANTGPGVYDAVPREVNRHAVQLHASTQLLADLKAGATAELAWRAEAHKFEAGLAAELLWNISDNLDLDARMEYYSGGAGPNANGSVLLCTLGLKSYW